MSVGPAVLDAHLSLSERDGVRSVRIPSDLPEHLAVIGALVCWAVPLTHATGGRDAGMLGWSLLAILPALLLLRVWRRPVACAAAGAVALAAVGVCMVAPTGWMGARDAASYVYTAGISLTVFCYCRTASRRTLLATVIAFAGIEQFVQALVPWWGGGAPSATMIGTFYWHNPYAAFLVAPALLGVALATASPVRAARMVGYVAAPLSVAGIVLSTSRATLAVTVAGLVLVALAAYRDGWARLRRFTVVVALCGVVTVVLPGPPLFSHWRSPFAGTTERSSSGESLAANGGYRTQFWREATRVGGAHPTTGAGFQSLGTASLLESDPTWTRSPYAHNGYLQAFSDGGLLLGAPFAGGCALLGFALLGAVRRNRFRLDGSSAVTVAAATAAAALAAHSFVDFDWTYPAAMAAAGIVAALAGSGLAERPRPAAAPRPIGVIALVALVSAIAVSVPAVWHWRDVDRASHNGSAASGVTLARLQGLGGGPFSDARPSIAILRGADTGQYTDRVTLLEAYRRTGRVATINPVVAALRARTLVLLGRPDDGSAAAHRLLSEIGDGRDLPIVDDLAVTLALAGDRAGARRALLPRLAGSLREGGPAAAAWGHVDAADKAGLLTESATRACVVTAAGALGPRPDWVTDTAGPPPADCATRIAALGR